MDERLRLQTLETLGPRTEIIVPDIDFMRNLHQRHGTELDALVGRSALDRPYSERQVTIAEIYYRNVLGRRSLFADDLQEVNRTVMNVFMRHTLQGPDRQRSYDTITNCQHPAVQLKHHQHAWLTDFTNDVLPTEELQIAMDTGLIDADLGKSEPIRIDLLTNYGREYADHDRLLLDLMGIPLAARRWMPSYYNLPAASQKLIYDNYASGYHPPQGIQSEVPSIKLMKFLKQSLHAQKFGLLLGLLDVSGAEGDTVQNGSQTLIEPVVGAFQLLVQAVGAGHVSGLRGKELALFVDNTYLRSRANLMGINFDGLHGREYTRLGCILRSNNEEQANFILSVVENRLQPQDRADLLELLSFTGFEQGGYAWIMYLPDFIRRYAEKLQDNDIAPEEALDIALTQAACLYRQIKEEVDLSPGVVMVAADLIRAFEKDPSIPLRSTIRFHRINDEEYRAAYDLAA